MWRTDYFLLLLLTISLSCSPLFGQLMDSPVPFQTEEEEWVDRLLSRMSPAEKLGQLLVLRSDLSQVGMTDSLLHWVHQQQLGGLILEDLPIDTFLHYVGISEQMTGIPLFNGTTQKIALHNQFSDITNLPPPATIGAIANDSILHILQEKYLEQLAGLHINFAYTPAITETYNTQAFAQSSSESICANRSWLTALTEQRILTLGQGFSTQLPDTNFAWREHFATGMSGVVIANQEFQKEYFECQKTGYLQQQLINKSNYNGLIVSELNADNDLGSILQTGADVLIVRDRIDQAFAELELYYKNGLLTKEELNQKVRKILLAKNWANNVNTPRNLPPLLAAAKSNPFAHQAKLKVLTRKREVKKVFSEEFCEEIHPIKAYFTHPAWDNFTRQLYEESIVLANNPEQTLPLRDLLHQDFRIFQYGVPVKAFVAQFQKYADAESSYIQAYSECNELPALSQKYLQKSTVILTLNQETLDTTLCQDWIASVNKLSQKTKVIVVNFGNPLSLRHFSPTVSAIQAMQAHPVLQSLTAQLIFGGTSANGALPMEVAPHLPFGISNHSPVIRLKYTIPAEVGIAPERLVGIDAMAKNTIANGATPGCRVLVAKDGKVIYNRSFGYHTYSKKQPVQSTDLYDLASITKVAATTLAAMKLHELQQIKPADRISQHLDLTPRTTLKYVTLRNLLIHKSGLSSNLSPIVPILSYRDTFNRNCDKYFCNEKTTEYSIPIADDFYFSQLHADTIWQKVQRMKVSRRRRYRYSDANFYLLQKVIEAKTHIGLDKYLNIQFYNGLGLRYLGYNPHTEFGPKDIVPTSYDNRWRKQLVHGYVHDETAAIQGGVGGNAGLFSSAEDLAVLFQMLLNGGHYGGRQFLNKNTIDYFTTARHGTHRGLGFDKPAKNSKKGAYARSVSSQTFGHTGFTGTAIWTDPQHNLTFIFLSNRIHPNASNRRLSEDKVRARMHQVVYDALGTFQGDLPELKMEQRI